MPVVLLTRLIDHFLCSKAVNDLVDSVNILYSRQMLWNFFLSNVTNHVEFKLPTVI